MRNWALLALLLVPAAASGQSLRVLDTLVLDYRGDNGNDVEGDDDYFLGYTKLYLTGEGDDMSARAQVDGVYFFSGYPEGTDEAAVYKSEARLERLSFAQRVGDATITLGDFHKQVGRGLALSLRRVDELGVDKALRGGQLEWEGDTFSWSAFAGRTNVSNLDGVTQRFLPDPEDNVVGGTGTVHLGPTDLSLYGVLLQSHQPLVPAKGEDRTLIGGGYVELPATDWLVLYGEGAASQFTVGGRAENGTAAYATADMDLRVVNVLLEGLYLDNFQVRGSQDGVITSGRMIYNQPPTLERIDQEVLDYENVRGGRAKVSKAFLDGDLVVYVNGMYRQSGPEAAVTDSIHGYGGFELTYGEGRSRWFASGGYRDETQDGESIKSMVHGETDWVQSLGRGWAVHLTVNHESRTADEDDFVRGTTLLGVEHDGRWSLTAELGYDDQVPDAQHVFVAGIATYRPADWVDLRTVVGSERGGIKCIGGVCREYPAFAGARFEATVQHDLL
jgi:hypothetical protein